FRALGMEPPCALPNLERVLLRPSFQHFACPMNRVAERARVQLGSVRDVILTVEEKAAKDCHGSRSCELRENAISVPRRSTKSQASTYLFCEAVGPKQNGEAPARQAIARFDHPPRQRTRYSR